MKNNAWVTVNNEFMVTSESICKSRHEWPQKSLFMVTNVLFYFLHAVLCPENTFPLKKIIDNWFRHCH